MNTTTNRFKGIAAACMLACLAAGCASKVSEEQLAKLRDLRQQEQVLTRQIQDKETEQTRLRNELQARKSELDNCNTNKKFVQDKLAQWPDVWPK